MPTRHELKALRLAQITRRCQLEGNLMLLMNVHVPSHSRNGCTCTISANPIHRYNQFGFVCFLFLFLQIELAILLCMFATTHTYRTSSLPSCYCWPLEWIAPSQRSSYDQEPIQCRMKTDNKTGCADERKGRTAVVRKQLTAIRTMILKVIQAR